MWNWFKGCLKVEHVKRKLRELAKQFHPDLQGGDLRKMQEINAEYDEILKSFSGKETFESKQGEKYTWYYKQEVETRCRDKVWEIYGLPGVLQALLSNELTLEVIGTWIWVTGNTKPFKEQLKKALRWHSKRTAWYWSDGRGAVYNPKASLDTLRAAYGCTSFNGKDAASNLED